MSDSYYGIIEAVNNLRHANGATPKEYSASFQGIAEALVDIKREWGGAQPGVYPPGWATSTDDNGVVTGDYLYAPKNGQLWFDERHGRLMIYLDDGFYQANGADVLTVVSNTQPTNSIDGALWWQPNSNSLYLFDGSSWINITSTTVASLKSSLHTAVNNSTDYASLKTNLLAALS